MYVISVIPLTKIPFPAPQMLDYFSLEKIASGGLVRASIGSRQFFGIVAICSSVLEQKQKIKKSAFRLRPIDKIISKECIVPKEYLNLAIWTSGYFYSPLGLVMKTFLPNIFIKPTKKFLTEINNSTPTSPVAAPPLPDKERGLGPDCRSGRGEVVLYHAHRNEKVKISFYSEEIKKTIENKKSVLFLVPEIYKIEYFSKKIPALKNSEIFHAGLTPSAQYKIWKKTSLGEIQILLGSRSALAIPMPNLGLIIVDDEESAFYKSFDQQPYINAKSVALKLANITGAKIILASDFPSFESLWHSNLRKYSLIDAPRPSAPLGEARVIDMREELKAGNYSILSRELREELKVMTKNNGQAILFINRKGHSSGLLCRDCGYILKCPNCEALAVFHITRSGPVAICHHCAKRQKPPSVCPECKSYRIKFIGTGTQRVERELIKFFKEKSDFISRMDTDIAPVFGLQKKILDDFREKKFNILVGTQLMLKSQLLPSPIDLAGIVTIDPMLSLPDFRTHEQALRIMNTIKGLAKKIIVQTYVPDNLTIKSISLPDAYVLDAELNDRKELSLPPFSQIIKLTYSHKDSQKAEQGAKLLKNKLHTQIVNCQLSIVHKDLPQGDNCRILGPAPAFIPRVNNRYIWQIMIKSKIKDITLRNKFLRVVPSDWKIDVDPVEMV